MTDQEYLEHEFKRLRISDSYKIKITDESDGETRWLTITPLQFKGLLKALKAAIKEG